MSNKCGLTNYFESFNLFKIEFNKLKNDLNYFQNNFCKENIDINLYANKINYLYTRLTYCFSYIKILYNIDQDSSVRKKYKYKRLEW